MSQVNGHISPVAPARDETSREPTPTPQVHYRHRPYVQHREQPRYIGWHNRCTQSAAAAYYILLRHGQDELARDLATHYRQLESAEGWNAECLTMANHIRELLRAGRYHGFLDATVRDILGSYAENQDDWKFAAFLLRDYAESAASIVAAERMAEVQSPR